MQNKWYVIGGIVLVALIIVLLLYLFREKIFGIKPADAKEPVINPIFPLKNGSFNLPQVGTLQTYLKQQGGKNCDGSALVVDSDFGINTECATLQILNVKEVSETLYKSLFGNSI